MKRIAITTGDQDGIGPEVTAKALRELGPIKGASFIVFRGSSSAKLFERLPFKRKICSSLEDALDLAPRSDELVEVVGDNPVDWVENAAKACLRKDLQGLVTGPLSKTLIRKSGRKDLGHTEILARLSKTPVLYQGYLGQEFHVVLATAHLPLKDVSRRLRPRVVKGAVFAADLLRSCLPRRKRKLPLAFVGLNPHAGEEGLLGREDLEIRRVLSRIKAPETAGPLVPDAAFSPANWKKYSVFIASYHDQGLIPFKMIHGQSRGAQISLGLPFVRTSVDHGTAKEIAGRNLANPGSMKDAVQWCLRLTKGL
ncbi:MAG TPA: 4-hydroxythreonine-4-phosphate dehydrogenase PdxA [Pseudobdellovibrionaceae bacterium]|nr:4-hydroxythreonine-4-phosphate dehydrogenase PdxA [Pseudobdellovibrionaceae bacterium]